MSEKKEYFEFLEEISERVKKNFEGKVKTEINTTMKNNGVSVIGLMIKGEMEQIAPNFYLDSQFVEWKSGTRSLDEIAVRLCHAYKEEMQKNSHLISAISFTWEEFRRNVFMRLVNRDRNKELLEGLPYLEFMDLAVVYYYSVRISEEVTGTMLITKEHMQILKVTREELHETAKSNIRRFCPLRFRSMEEVLKQFGTKIGIPFPELCERNRLMYVLSNQSGMFGAVSMLFSEELERFSERIENSFYLLPSSVHEVILVPDQEKLCPEGFAEMVKEINDTQVEETEVLSDSVYYFDRRLKSLRRVR